MKDFVEQVRKAGTKDLAYQEGWKGASEDPGPDTLRIENGLLYRKSILWVPEGEGIMQEVLQSEHDTKVTGHMRKTKRSSSSAGTSGSPT